MAGINRYIVAETTERYLGNGPPAPRFIDLGALDFTKAPRLPRGPTFLTRTRVGCNVVVASTSCDSIK